jgi:drug/metabolite transporter superfamily protein YnfA
MSDKRINEFEKAALEQRDISTLSEFWYLLRQNKKWWLVPVLVSLVIFGAIMVLSGTAAAPFIYTLF